VQAKYLPKLGVSICAGTDGTSLPAGRRSEGGKIMADAKRFILTSFEISQREQPFSHPWNPKSQLIGVQLSRALGLKRTGVSIARIPSGKESFVYHSHQSEEEWLYILSGRGIAEIDGEEIEIAAGAFMAFPTPSVPHHLKNPFDQDVIYLMGGENHGIEIADFPRLGKRMIRNGDQIDIYQMADAKPFGPLEP
jgi:uncharacterized cupin superfamily protein